MAFTIRTGVVSVCATLASVLVGPIAASQEQASPTPDANSSPETRLEEVTVTAERRVSNIQTTPIAITAVSGQELREQAKTDVAAVLNDVPSVSVQATPQGGQIFIRGVGANGDSNAVDPAVSLMVDGVYSGIAEEVLGSLYDIQRVEVLRGPQGTLYGRNATGGSVNIISNDPVNQYEAAFNGEVASFQHYHGDAMVNIPIGNTLSFRLAGLYETGSRYYDNNDGGDFRKTALRAKLLWNPNDDLSVLAFASYAHKYGLTLSSSPIPHPLTEGPPPFQWDSRSDNPWYIDSFHIPDREDNHYLTAGAQIDYRLGWATLTILPSYRDNQRIIVGNLLTGAFPTGVLDVASNTNAFKERQYTGEIRLASAGSSGFNWVVGLYGLHDNNAPSQGLIDNSGVTENIGGMSLPAKSLAAFGQLTYSVAEHTRLTGGLRYTHDKKTADYHYISVAIPGYDGGDQQTSASYSAVTYKVGVEQDVGPASFLYAQVATGYKAGGFGLDLPPTSYKPEHLTAFEIGSKNRFLEQRLQLNGEIYLYKYRDAQVQAAVYEPYSIPAQYIPPAALVPQFMGGNCGGTPPNCLFGQPDLNAQTATNYGGELELRYLFTAHDEFDLSSAYTHATYGTLELPGQLSGFGGPPGATVTTYTNAAGALVLTGTQTAHAPTYSGRVGYKHDWELGRGQITASAYSNFSSSYWATVNKEFYGAQQGSYHRSDAFLTYSPGIKQWSVTAYVKNIENDAQKEFVFPLYRAVVTPPRSYGVTFALNY